MAAPGHPIPPRAPEGARLAAVFVRLKLSLLRNGLRQSSARTALFVLSLVLVALVAAGQLLGLVMLRGHEDAATLTVMLIGVLGLGWAVLPLFFHSGDDTLDATRLAMLPLRPRPLVGALLAGSLAGVGPAFALVLAIGSAIALAHGAVAAAVAVVAVPLTLLVCVALARSITAANTRLLTSRRGRDLAVLGGLLIAVGAQIVNYGVQRVSERNSAASLEPVAEIVRWLPPASAVGAIDSASRGSTAVALLQLALTALTLAGLLWWWERSLTRLMTSPDDSTVAAVEPAKEHREGPSALSRLLPEGRAGTAAERTLRYVWRHPKLKAGWVTGLALGLFIPLMNAFQGSGSVYGATFAAGLLGINMYNQFGQDSSAFWMVAQTISTSRDAREELRGRALALLLITLPYTVIAVLVVAAVVGDWSELPSALGLSLAALGALLATGSVASALYPYSIPQDEAHKSVAPGQGALAWLSLLGGILAATVLCAPVIAATVWLHLSDGHDLLWLILPLGTAWGALLAWSGIHVAAPMTARRLPEILTAVSRD
ncbi:transporter [Streptomyces sp. NPDC000594]|uniref:transporter n=1 Tax=Streptomyces sp. NPDC000594 TaxID=3154261 RepID=UPI0033258041